MAEEESMSILRAIKEQLNRIEERQIRTTAMVEDVEHKEEQKVQGSFASSELG